MSKSSIEERVTDLVGPVARELALELVDVEFVKERERWYLRLYIDREGGVGLEDCEKMSRAADVVLDEADPIAQSYYLEVSSPGVERALKKPADFVRFSGEKALIRTLTPVCGLRKLEGRIAGVTEVAVLLDMGGGAPVSIAFDSISKANLVFEW